MAVSEDSTQCHRPTVKPITDANGIQREYPDLVLSHKREDGAYPDEILSAVDADSLGLDISRYFI